MKKPIESYYVYVYKIANKFRGLDFPLKDLEAYGMVGLMVAWKKFDEEKGQNFGTYAWYKIHGAIVEGLHSMGWVQRHRSGSKTWKTEDNFLFQEELKEVPEEQIYMIQEEVARQLDIKRAILKLTTKQVAWIKKYGDSGGAAKYGKALGVEKSWASRLHKRMIQKLKVQVGA